MWNAGLNGERIWMDLNVLHIPRYTLVDPHHYHHPLPWNPMNLRSNNSQIFFFLKFNGICSSELQRVSPLHPLLPTNFSSELQSFPFIPCYVQTQTWLVLSEKLFCLVSSRSWLTWSPPRSCGSMHVKSKLILSWKGGRIYW